MYKKIEIFNTSIILLALACFITNISQLPSLIESEYSRILSVGVWGFMGIYCLLKCYISFTSKVLFPIIIMSILLLWSLLLTIFTSNEYLNTSLLYSFYLSMFIFFVGFWLSKDIKNDKIHFLILSYAISSVILSINIFINYLAGVDIAISGSTYFYGAKNSVSQILFTALVFLFLAFRTSIFTIKFLRWVSFLFLLMVILFLKSRATILEILVMVLVPLFTSIYNKKLKVIVFISIAIFLLLLTNEYFYNFLFNNIIFAGRDYADLDAVSSGRWAQIDAFPYLIDGHEIIGLGNWYIESFPLDAWLQYGYLFGSLFILVSVWPIYWGLKYLSKSNFINIAFIIIAMSYWINGLFEQLAPFGPGVKCYMLWLLFGILLGNKNTINTNGEKHGTIKQSI